MGRSATMTQDDVAICAIKRKDRSIATAMKGSTSCIRRDDGSKQSGRVIRQNEFRVAIEGRNTKIAKFFQKMLMVISDSQGNGTTRDINNMPQTSKTVSCGRHSTTVKMSADRITGANDRINLTEVMVMGSPACFEGRDLRIHGVQGSRDGTDILHDLSKDGSVRLDDRDRRKDDIKQAANIRGVGNTNIKEISV